VRLSTPCLPIIARMLTPPSDATPPIAALASACVHQLPTSPTSFAADRALFHATFEALLTAVAASDARLAFDRDGRPQAVSAVRHALPAMEAELFEAILEDLACELAATQEALYRVALAMRATPQS